MVYYKLYILLIRIYKCIHDTHYRNIIVKYSGFFESIEHAGQGTLSILFSPPVILPNFNIHHFVHKKIFIN